MGYTEQRILQMCQEEMKNPETFYRAKVINYRGRTTDTGVLYNELVATFVCDHLDAFVDGIPTITRKASYNGHTRTGDHIPSNQRKEEQIAVELFNQKHLDYIGHIVDYQTPLKNVATDEVGKIDLLAYDGKTLRILELKKPDSNETMLRCVLEGYTYMRSANLPKLLQDFGLPADTAVVACPLVFANGEQHRDMQEDRPALKKLMQRLNSKPYYVTKENQNYTILEKVPFMTKTQIPTDLNKSLDHAIMAMETAKDPNLKAGYLIDERLYDNYLSNPCWKAFVDDMKIHHPTAYAMFGQGSGNELEKRQVGGNTYPPKMASFGSSSRMIFNLMKQVDGFLFEKKLPTTVGGIAHLDGFMETAEKYVFVEAKCREPYTKKNTVYDVKYRALYEAITASDKTSVRCEAELLDSQNIKVRFMVGDTEVRYFDLKQMISHLLGVATALLNDTLTVKDLDFVYLLFNPTRIPIPYAEEEIHNRYAETCRECTAVDFKALFGVIVDYLQTAHHLGTNKDLDAIVNRFHFRLCDQDNMTL